MKKLTVKHHMDGLAALLLFAVFAASILAVLLTGAGAYRRLTLRDQQAYAQRTAVQYVAQRVRQAPGAVAVEDFHGADALVLESGDGYVTRVYCWNGSLMELYCAGDLDLNPEDGEKVMEAASLELTLDQGLLTARVDGGPRLYLSLRGGEGVLS